MKFVKADDQASPIYALMHFVDGLDKKYGRRMRDVPIAEVKNILSEDDNVKLERAIGGEVIKEELLPTIKFEVNQVDLLDLIEAVRAYKSELSMLDQDHTDQYAKAEKLQRRLVRSYQSMGVGDV